MKGSSSVTPVPRGRDRTVTADRPVVLYRGDDATVTTRYFRADGAEYPVAELEYLERIELGGLLQGRLFELWARFRGQRVRLFHSGSARRFGQVCRALIRAREVAGLA